MPVDEGSGRYTSPGNGADEMNATLGGNELGRDLTTIEWMDRQEIDEAPPEVDPEQLVEDFDQARLGGEEFEDTLIFRDIASHHQEPAKFPAGLSRKGNQNSCDHRTEEEESCTGSGEDHDDAARSRPPPAFIVGKTSKTPEPNGLASTSEPASAQGMAQLVHEDGDEYQRGENNG